MTQLWLITYHFEKPLFFGLWKKCRVWLLPSCSWQRAVSLLWCLLPHDWLNVRRRTARKALPQVPVEPNPCRRVLDRQKHPCHGFFFSSLCGVASCDILKEIFFIHGRCSASKQTQLFSRDLLTFEKAMLTQLSSGSFYSVRILENIIIFALPTSWVVELSSSFGHLLFSLPVIVEFFLTWLWESFA